MEFRKKEYAPFDIFDSEWAVITVGNKEKFDKNSFIQEIRDYYEQYPDVYTDGHGGWEPHFILLGEIEEVIE